MNQGMGEKRKAWKRQNGEGPLWISSGEDNSAINESCVDAERDSKYLRKSREKETKGEVLGDSTIARLKWAQQFLYNPTYF